MPSSSTASRPSAPSGLPADFWWVDNPGKSTLLFASVPIVQIEASGTQWEARIALPAAYVVPQHTIYSSLDEAKRWADSWVRQRLALIARIIARMHVANQDRITPATN